MAVRVALRAVGGAAAEVVAEGEALVSAETRVSVLTRVSREAGAEVMAVVARIVR